MARLRLARLLGELGVLGVESLELLAAVSLDLGQLDLLAPMRGQAE